MVVNRKPRKEMNSMPAVLAIGWCIEMLVTLVGTMLLSVLILGGRAGWEASGYGVMGILLLASYIGAAFSCRHVIGKKLITCCLSGIIYFSTLLAITILFFDSQFSSVWLLAVLVGGGAGLAILLHGHPSRERPHKHKRRRL